MPPAPETFSPGIEVEIERIDRELKNLWEQSADSSTRASLVNLAVHSHVAGSLQRNTELISRITQDHACRAIVIEANRAATEDRVHAWISAHCHVSRAGAKQICSEQISFLLEGPCSRLLTSIVFSHLDSDLPFYLWWQGEFSHPMDPQLWAWVDRVIYDSQTWRDFNAQMALVETAQREASQRIVLCDLNWTRLDKIRLGVAQFFDHPAAHHHFNKIDAVHITFAPGYRSTALLLAGWLAAQLKWQLKTGSAGDVVDFDDAAGRNIRVEVQEQAGEPVSEITLRTPMTTFSVRHPDQADLLELRRDDSNGRSIHQLLPAGTNDLVQLMSDELYRGGLHAVYLRVINCVRDLF